MHKEQNALQVLSPCHHLANPLITALPHEHLTVNKGTCTIISAIISHYNGASHSHAQNPTSTLHPTRARPALLSDTTSQHNIIAVKPPVTAKQTRQPHGATKRPINPRARGHRRTSSECSMRQHELSALSSSPPTTGKRRKATILSC